MSGSDPDRRGLRAGRGSPINASSEAIHRGRLSIIAALVVLCGCSGPPDALHADADAYLEQMKRWGAVQSATSQSIDRILATQFVDDSTVLHEIEESRPRVLDHLSVARRYTPRTREVGDIHRAYVAAWEDLMAGYSEIERGVQRADAKELATGRTALLRWRSAMVDVAKQLRDVGNSRNDKGPAA